MSQNIEIVIVATNTKSRYDVKAVNEIIDKLEDALTEQLFEFVEIQWGETS